MKQRFSAMAFLTIKPLLQAIYLHPFVVELVDGILSRERFLYYMQQDSLYLVDYGRALALTGGKLHEEKSIALMLHFAEQALVAEREMHEKYFNLYQISPAEDKAPACFAYCAHLLERAALGSAAEGMAALLPCFWIYREVGNHVRVLADADNPWYAWIENYSSEEYSLLVDKAVDLTDRLAAGSSDDELERMFKAFVASSRLEYAFWDDAYYLRDWPPQG